MLPNRYGDNIFSIQIKKQKIRWVSYLEDAGKLLQEGQGLAETVENPGLEIDRAGDDDRQRKCPEHARADPHQPF